MQINLLPISKDFHGEEQLQSITENIPNKRSCFKANCLNRSSLKMNLNHINESNLVLKFFNKRFKAVNRIM